MPNILELLNGFSPERGLTIDRIKRIKREGSPAYTWNYPATGPGVIVTIDPETTFPASRKYAPLDSIEVVNNEPAINLTLTINGKETRIVPAGTIRQVSGRGVALRRVALTNDHATDTTTLGRIVVTLQKEAYTIDRWASDRS